MCNNDGAEKTNSFFPGFPESTEDCLAQWNLFMSAVEATKVFSSRVIKEMNTWLKPDGPAVSFRFTRRYQAYFWVIEIATREKETRFVSEIIRRAQIKGAKKH